MSALLKLKPGERSPAEKAFDFLMFPSVFNAILLIAAFFTSTAAGSEGEAIGMPAAWTRALTAGGVLSLIHWLIGARKVRQSWDDPFGKVLRFSSVGVLAMQALAIVASFLAS